MAKQQPAPDRDLAALLEADLTDLTNRLVLADALVDAGRDTEAAVCRDLTQPLMVFQGNVIGSEELLEIVRKSATAFQGLGQAFRPVAETLITTFRAVAQTMR